VTAHRLLAGLVVGLTVGLSACGGDDLTIPPTTGTIAVTTVTSGSEPDADGYTVQVDAQQPVAIGSAATVAVENLAPGAHNVLLSGMATNCTVQGENPRTLTVLVGETTNATFLLDCGSTSGSLEVTTQTSGDTPDADGYGVSFDGSDRGAIGSNATITLSSLPVGSHVVGLTGLSANCQVQGDNLRAVTIAAGATSTVTFAVSCVPPAAQVGTLRITTTTGGPNRDENGYQFTIDGGQAQPIEVNSSATLTNIAAGSHEVALSDVAANCQVAGGSSKTVAVPANGTTTLAFSITCSAVGPTTGSIQVTTSTSGPDPDTDGYQFTIDGGPSQNINSDGSETVSNISPGSHEVVLTGVAANCTVDNGSSKTASVAVGVTTTLEFTITCSPISPSTGSIRVATITMGDNQDTDYQLTIEGVGSQPIGGDAGTAVTVTNVSTGNHRVTLSGVADNCEVDDDSQTVTVTPGAQSDVLFTITCTSVQPSATRSDVSVNPDAIPAGSGSSTVRVVVKDANGDRLNGVTVTPSATGGGNQFAPASAVTGSDGEAAFAFSSTEAGDKTITINAGGVILEETEVITVVAHATTTTITGVAPEPSTPGESVHVTWQVTGEGGGTPTGTVTVFSLNEAAGCTVDVSQGFCDFVLNVVDRHRLGVVYSGDAQFEDSSDATDHDVVAAPAGP
jgi:hypothetical protein